MDKTAVIQLIGVSRTVDALRQVVETELPAREIFCSLRSASRSEWAAVGQRRLKPTACVTVWANEYEDESIAVLDGQRYGVYRTYQPNPEEIELYLAKKGGV